MMNILFNNWCLKKIPYYLLLIVILLTISCGGDENNPATDESSDPDGNTTPATRIALSVSPFSEIILNAGLQPTDGMQTATTLEQLSNLYIAYGGNEIFARMSTERTTSVINEDRSLAQGINRANLALSLNLPLNPELGLFGTYGDGSCQTQPNFSEYPEITVPGTWETLTVDQMLPILRQYAQIVAQAIIDTGVNVNIWDIGNEIGFGTAGVAPQPLVGSLCDELENSSNWYRAPDVIDPVIGTESVLSLRLMSEGDRIIWLKAHIWPHEARLLAAVAEGILSVDSNAKFSTHIGYGLGATFAVEFYQAMSNGGFDVAEAGFSFYPSAAATPEGQLTKFKNVVTAVRAALNVPVFIAEYAYPAEPMTIGPYATWNNEVPGYPISEVGQSALLEDLMIWGKDNGISGIRPWAPDVFVGHWIPMALFDASGNARPSLSSISTAN